MSRAALGTKFFSRCLQCSPGMFDQQAFKGTSDAKGKKKHAAKFKDKQVYCQVTNIGFSPGILDMGEMRSHDAVKDRPRHCRLQAAVFLEDAMLGLCQMLYKHHPFLGTAAQDSHLLRINDKRRDSSGDNVDEFGVVKFGWPTSFYTMPS